MAKKGIPTLIKLKKRQVDELRKELAGFERQKDALQEMVQRLADELQAEMQLSAQAPEMMNYLGNYSQRVRKRQEDLRKEINQLEQRILTLRTKLADLFGEQKRYEIVEANAKERERKAEARKEQIQLDEMGGNGFMRNDNAV